MPAPPSEGVLFPTKAEIESANVKLAFPIYRKILSQKARPKFQNTKAKGLLKQKIREAYNILKSCELCEHRCRIDRTSGQRGICKVGDQPVISSAFIHVGEEPFIVPSFTIFFMGCSFKCQYCQNWTISQWYEPGIVTTAKKLSNIINEHPECANVNFVGGDPTPHLPFVLDALQYVKINIPVVWNSNFYMSKRSMDLLSGIVDIYLSDWKYGNDDCATRLSKIKNYWSIVKRNHDIAFKDSEMLIRHLVLPNHFKCCTKPILEYISENYKKKVIVNIMGQYRPEWNAHKYPEIARPPTFEELERAWALAKKLNLNWIK